MIGIFVLLFLVLLYWWIIIAFSLTRLDSFNGLYFILVCFDLNH